MQSRANICLAILDFRLRGINVMISPQPRNKRSKAPQPGEGAGVSFIVPKPRDENHRAEDLVPVEQARRPPPGGPVTGGFVNNAFAQLEINR